VAPPPVTPPVAPPVAPPLPPVAPPVAPKMVRTAPSVTPARVLTPDDDDVELLWAKAPSAPEPVLATIARPLTRPPVPVSPPAGPAKMMRGRSLSDLVSGADAEVDVDAILAKPAPPPPPED
jgi:hypothetical protein